MIAKSKKVLETEKYVDEFILKYNFPPTYIHLSKHFKIAANTAWYRCSKFRDKMRENGQNIKLGRYDLLEKRISELESRVEQMMPYIN